MIVHSLDPGLLDEMINEFNAQDIDYFANCIPQLTLMVWISKSSLVSVCFWPNVNVLMLFSVNMLHPGFVIVVDFG